MKKIALCVSVCILFSMLFVHNASANTSHTEMLWRSAHPNSTPLFVKANGGDLAACTSWATACSLRKALADAESGDQIWVAAGTYKPTTTETDKRTATFTLEFGVAIYGGFPKDGGAWPDRDWQKNITTLSGDIGTGGDSSDNSYHVVTGNGVDATAVLDGFTISGGNADGTDPHNNGGGMYNNSGSPTLTNLTFSNNVASVYGAGMYNNMSSPIISNVTFSNNEAGDRGGGLYNYNTSNPNLTNVTFNNNSSNHHGGGIFNSGYSSPALSNVTFNDNSSGNGGGMCNYFYSSPTLTNVTFNSNIATYFGGGILNSGYSSPVLSNVTFNDNSSEDGGGMYNLDHSSPALTNVTFSGNSSEDGGGMENKQSSPTLTNVTFNNNTVILFGGGMFNIMSSPTLTNVTFSGNSSAHGSGMYNLDHSSPILTNVTFVNNAATTNGGGMRNYDNSSPTLVNTILWGNTPDQISTHSSDPAAVTFSVIQDGYSGGTNIIEDDPLLGPLADNGGFTQTHALGVGSTAIDAGDPDHCPPTDQRGFSRPIDGNGDGVAKPDVGACEFGYTLSITTIGSGSVSVEPEKTEYKPGDLITLTATAELGWTFTGWSGNVFSTDNPLTVAMNSNKNVTATFTQEEYILIVSEHPVEDGTVTVSPDQGTYHYGDGVTLTANPEPNCTFTGWSGDASGTENPLLVTIQGNTTIVANFNRPNFPIFLPLILRQISFFSYGWGLPPAAAFVIRTISGGR